MSKNIRHFSLRTTETSLFYLIIVLSYYLSHLEIRQILKIIWNVQWINYIMVV